MEDMEPTPQPPMVSAAPDRPFSKIRQVTVRTDEEIEGINSLLADGWRLLSIGFRPDATVYVLGQFDKKPRTRAGFGFKYAGEEGK